MNISRNINPTPQFFDSAGDPLSSGLMYYFESGTNTPKTTFSDVNETTANPHPVVLTGDGRLPNVFFSGSAKQILADSTDVQIWERDPVTSDDQSSFGKNWDSVTVYGLNEVVTFNEILYVSIINVNQNNQPTSVATAWTQFDLLKRWNVNETYEVRDPVIATDFTIYISQVSSNTGNDPTVPSANWAASGAGSGGVFSFVTWDASINYGSGTSNIVESTIDNNYYVSIQTPNLNNEPSVSASFWTQIDFIKGGGITIIGSTIASTATDEDINLTPNGTGTVVVGTDLDVDNINIDGNTISSTDTDGDITITPDGDGDLNLNPAGAGKLQYNGDEVAVVFQTKGSEKLNWPTVQLASGDPLNDIQFNVGVINSTNGVFIDFDTQLDKEIDNPWVAGDGNGGLFTGTAGNMTYHMFVIYDPINDLVDAGFDTDVNAANRPAAYTEYRRLASDNTEGSANWVPFTQSGDNFLINDTSNDTQSFNNPGTSTQQVFVQAPALADISTIVDVSLRDISPSGAVYCLIRSSFQDDIAASAARSSLSTRAGSESDSARFILPTSSLNFFFRLHASDADVTVRTSSQGWIDPRIS